MDAIVIAGMVLMVAGIATHALLYWVIYGDVVMATLTPIQKIKMFWPGWSMWVAGVVLLIVLRIMDPIINKQPWEK